MFRLINSHLQAYSLQVKSQDAVHTMGFFSIKILILALRNAYCRIIRSLDFTMLLICDKNKTSRTLEIWSSNKGGGKPLEEETLLWNLDGWKKKARNLSYHKCKLFFFRYFTSVSNSPGRHFPTSMRHTAVRTTILTSTAGTVKLL